MRQESTTTDDESRSAQRRSDAREVMLYLNELVPDVPFTVVGELAFVRRLLPAFGGGDGTGIAPTNLTAYVVRYDFPATRRPAILFADADATVPRDRQYVLRASNEFVDASTGLVAATAVPAGAAEPSEVERDSDGVATAFRLGGRATGWRGYAPERIDGTVNPTLELRAGRRYEVTWENVDGLLHNFAVADAEGDVLYRTELVGEEGATRTLTFPASTEMATYYCGVHTDRMRGRIRVANG